MNEQSQTVVAPLTDPEKWVDLYADDLFRYAVCRVREESVAEDLVQETLLAAIKGRERFAGQSSEKSWLFSILKHKIIDHIRQKSRERQVFQEETIPCALDEQFDDSAHWKIHEGFGPREWIGDAAATFARKEFWAVLDACLGKLPPRTAQAFVLREMEDMASEQVCEVLNVTPNNLWVLLHRARMQLRHCLEANWFESQSNSRRA